MVVANSCNRHPSNVLDSERDLKSRKDASICHLTVWLETTQLAVTASMHCC